MILYSTPIRLYFVVPFMKLVHTPPMYFDPRVLQPTISNYNSACKKISSTSDLTDVIVAKNSFIQKRSVTILKTLSSLQLDSLKSLRGTSRFFRVPEPWGRGIPARMGQR